MLTLLLLSFFAADDLYGAELHKDTPVVSIEALMQNPEKWLGKMVKVEGVAQKVCPMKGCWIDIKEGDTKVRIKVKDGDIVFDKELEGKQVIAEGTVYKFELTKEKAIGYYKHLAEELGEPFDESSVTGPATIYQIGGLGLRVK